MTHLAAFLAGLALGALLATLRALHGDFTPLPAYEPDETEAWAA